MRILQDKFTKIISTMSGTFIEITFTAYEFISRIRKLKY